MFQSFNLEDTKNLAFELAKFIEMNDIILFKGEMGTGKTQIIKFICLALGFKDIVTSPSFNVVNIYELENFNKIVHVDFFRISREIELSELGLDEVNNLLVTLIEWGEKFEFTFTEYLLIEINFVEGMENIRKFNFVAHGDSWIKKLSNISDFK